MLYDDTDWPEWIEELFDNDQECVKITSFDWEFVEDDPNNSYEE